jgi:DnaJ homolog subfamily C member 1
MIIKITILLFISNVVMGWDTSEMQMFDLVEELKVNFYEFLGVNFNATSAEVRRAYRRLSLEMHPDKNKDDPTADKKFQKLVAVYEVLRDEEMRNKYNEVLEHGLPDWRMPVFYFRKLRKMTIWETIGLLVMLMTTFHFAIVWGIYLEKKLTVEDHLNTSFRRRKTLEQRKLKGGPSLVDAEIAKKLDSIPKPRFIDILPIAIVRGIYWLVTNAPNICCETYQLVKESFFEQRRSKMEKLREAEERKKELEDRMNKRRLEKERKKEMAKLQYEEQLQFICREANTLLSQVDDAELKKAETISTPSNGKTDDSNDNLKKSVEWEPAELVQLIQAVAKYPGGTSNRWQKIADYVQRPVPQVITMVKEIQQQQILGASINPKTTKETDVDGDNNSLVNSLQANGQLRLRRGRRVDIWEAQQTDVVAHLEEDEQDEGNQDVINPLLNDNSDSDDDNQLSSAKKKQLRKAARKKPSNDKGNSKNEDAFLEDHPEISTETNPPEDAEQRKERKKPRTKEKYVANDASQTPRMWSQDEQKQLEQALRTYPKGTIDRWDRIAENVPTRSKEECISRVKQLAEKMQSKESKS